MTTAISGIWSAVLTPFAENGTPDHKRLARHCRWLLDNGCDGLSVLGTNGEGNSLAVDERLGLIEALVAAGIPAARLLPGTGCCAVPDTVCLSRHAMVLGVAGVLVLPPFYYKNVSDDGVFAAFAEVVERIGDARLRIYLYHFPQMAGVAIRPSLMERLLTAYPGTFAGIKDSSGDASAMIANAQRFPELAVFSGSDEHLLPLLRAGGAGCITGVSNIAAHVAQDVLSAWRDGDVEAAEVVQARLTAIRRAVTAFPLTPALKEIMAQHSGEADWRRLRPPLLPLSPTEAEALAATLGRLDFHLPPLP